LGIPKPVERISLIMGPNVPLTLIDWKLTSIHSTEDKYDNKIIGRVKNNSKGNLSELRIEFTVYNDDEAQIVIVSQNTYDLKPGEIWNFALLVTHDVGKARLKGLYCVPPKELRRSEGKEE